MIKKCSAVLFVMALLFESSANGQKTPHHQISYSFDSSFLKHKGDTSALELFIDIYADSINNIKQIRIPAFLDNTQLDYDFCGFSSADHPISVRKLIFDKISKCEALLIILNESSGRFRKIPREENEIQVEYLQMSYRDLAKKRYEEMKCAH